ncbi:MAG: hypothetical protein AB1758_37640 [Candidatus Eremiobacterota bacterium]
MRELDEELHPVQWEILRRMTPAQRFEIAAEMTRAVWNAALDGLRRARPELDDRQLLKEFVALQYGRDLAYP